MSTDDRFMWTLDTFLDGRTGYLFEINAAGLMGDGIISGGGRGFGGGTLRFPERRDFFLEGSGVLSFAPRSGPSLFYSRNIGIRDGQQVPIR